MAFGLRHVVAPHPGTLARLGIRGQVPGLVRIGESFGVASAASSKPAFGAAEWRVRA